MSGTDITWSAVLMMALYWLFSLMASGSKHGLARAELTVAEAEKEAAEAKLLESHITRANEDRVRLARLEVEIEALRQQYADMKVALEAAQQQVADTKTELLVREQDMARLKVELQTRTIELEAAQRKITELVGMSGQVDELKVKLALLEERVMHLEQTIAEKDAEIARLREEKAEAERRRDEFERQVQDKQRQIERLEAEKAELEKRQRDQGNGSL